MSRKRPLEPLIKQLHVAGAGELTGMRGSRSFPPIRFMSHTLAEFQSKITDALRVSERKRERERSSRRFYRERFLTDGRKHATSITGCLIGCQVSDSGEESMAVVDSYHHQRHKSASDTKLFTLCPFWQSGGQTSSSSSSSTQKLHGHGFKSNPKTVSSVARSLLPPRRRLRLDPANKLYFPYEPGKQVKSAIRLKNSSRSHVAFKFQTTAPKSCFMRPPGGILAPGESLIATVFRFVEQPEKNEKQLDRKTKVKFKIMSLKVDAGIEYAPELFDEQKDQVTVERILRVVFLNAEHPSPALEKVNRQLAEAEAALEVRKKPPADSDPPRDVGEGLVIDEWKERREKYLARQQVEAVDSV